MRAKNQGFQGFTNHYPLSTAFKVFTNHESRLLCFSRITKHGFFSPWVRKGRTIGNPRLDRRTRRPVAAFLRVMARHGRHGAPGAAVRALSAPATGPFGFSRDPRYGYCLARGASQHDFRGFHETRITRHESRTLCFPTHYFPRFPTISRHFPAFPGPPPPPPDQMPGLRPPFSLSLTTNAVRQSSRRPVAAFLRVVARQWRGMGGMGRPEPLSAHHPHQQQGLSGFHETRDPRHGYCLARGASQSDFRGFHETRITAFFEERSGLRCQASACGAVLDQRYNFARQEGGV